MADEVGLSRLTLAALADRLGVRQPSLYKHMDSMAGLQRSISLQSKKELGDVLARAAVGRSGADAIHAMSHAYRGWALKHPARYEASNMMPAADDTESAAASLASIQIIAALRTMCAAVEMRSDTRCVAREGMRASAKIANTAICAHVAASTTETHTITIIATLITR